MSLSLSLKLGLPLLSSQIGDVKIKPIMSIFLQQIKPWGIMGCNLQHGLFGFHVVSSSIHKYLHCEIIFGRPNTKSLTPYVVYFNLIHIGAKVGKADAHLL